MEKRNQKEAQRIERGHRRSSASSQTRSKRSKSDLTMQSEKGGMFGSQYTSTTPQSAPYTGTSLSPINPMCSGLTCK